MSVRRKAQKNREEHDGAWKIGVTIALIIINVAVYAAVRHHDFVDYDDRGYLTENPHVKTGLTWDNVTWAFTTGHQANWHPLTWLSHMVDVELYGMQAGPHHVTSLVFHILNTLLLFLFLEKTTGALWRSAFVAAMFAVHPLHVESVAWASERKDVLSGFFWLLTLLAYAAYVRRPGLSRYLIMFSLFVLGLMAKPMLVTLPFVMLLLDVWPLNRFDASTAVRLVREKAPLFAAAAASSVITFVVQREGGAVYSLDKLPFISRAANAAGSYLAYIGDMFWPSHLAIFYPFPESVSFVWFGFAVLLLLGITFAAMRAAGNHPYLTVGWLWYLGTLVPVIGLVQVGSQARADRYTYIPYIGLFVIIAWGLPNLAKRWPALKTALPFAALAVILASAVVARAQTKYWENSEMLWSHAVDVTVRNSVAHGNYGYVFWKQGKTADAIAQYEEALRINPNFPEALSHLGVALAEQGKLTEALAQFRKALELNPQYAEAHNNIGPVLANLGNLDESIVHFTEALRLKPEYADAHSNLAVALARQGKQDEAISHYSAAVRLNPDHVGAHYGLALALLKQGRDSDAIVELREVLRIDPNNVLARNALDALTK